MKAATVAATRIPAAARLAMWRLALLAVLVALADWLLYDAPWALSLVCFLLLLTGATLLAYPRRRRRRELAEAAGLLLLGLLPLLESTGPLPVLFGVVGAAYAGYSLTAGGGQAPTDRLAAALRQLCAGPPQALLDLCRPQGLRRDLAVTRPLRHAALWILPLALGGLFLALFAAANPVIELWLDSLAPDDLLRRIGPTRIAFWVVSALVLWSFVFVRRRGLPAWSPQGDAPAAPRLGEAVVLRSLLLFNLLFTVQTLLDALYLWGGAALPDGMTYAAYAHRGAYPLILTALLAGAFVLLAVRPGAAVRRRTLVLVQLWIGQNLLLVLSSLLRLDLYVAAYSLTWLRAAAFVWMLLVGVGLILLLLRIVLRRSNLWLVGANLGAAVATLYLCCFVNVPLVIAGYNVAHSRELTGEGPRLDRDYLVALGPEALPALDAFIAHLSGAGRVSLDDRALLLDRAYLARLHAAESADWRAWSFRGQRLTQYLEERHDR